MASVTTITELLGFLAGIIVGIALTLRLSRVAQLVEQNIELRESLRGVLELLPFVSGPLCTRARAALDRTGGKVGGG